MNVYRMETLNPIEIEEVDINAEKEIEDYKDIVLEMRSHLDTED